jgi:hypothetical protein
VSGRVHEFPDLLRKNSEKRRLIGRRRNSNDIQILAANYLEGKENSTEGMPIKQAALICIYKVPFNLSNIHTVFKNMSTGFIMWYDKM